MYRVSKRMEISAMHHLNLDYESPCQNSHGHNWIITVEIRGTELDENGMLLDFTKIKELIHGQMDHQNLNEVFQFNPTAENIARWAANCINMYIINDVADINLHCYKVKVQETEGNYAIWEE